MARSLRIEFPGAQYHVMARGNGKQVIFRDEADFVELLRLLGVAARRHAFRFHAYALLTNHFHLLLETLDGGLSAGMHLINGLYAQYFNSRHQSVGHLLQGRFKALLVDTNSYWLTVSRYIHQNPVKAGFAANPWDYRWSSCRQLLGIEPENSWLDTGRTLGYFIGSEDPRLEYRHFLQALDEPDPWEKAVGQSLLGSNDFVAAMRRKAEPKARGEGNFAYKKALTARPSPQTVLKVVDRHFASVDGRKHRSWKNPPRKMAEIHLLRELAGVRLADIAVKYGMRTSAITQALRRFKGAMDKDSELAARINTLSLELEMDSPTDRCRAP